MTESIYCNVHREARELPSPPSIFEFAMVTIGFLGIAASAGFLINHIDSKF